MSNDPLLTPDHPDHEHHETRKLRDGLAIVALGLLIFTLLYLILRELTDILRPLFVAIFVCYIIVPAQRFLVRFGLSSTISYITIAAVTVILTMGIGRLLLTGVGDLVRELPAYVQRIEAAINTQVDALRAQLPVLQPTTAPADAVPEPGATRIDLISAERLVPLIQGTLQTFVGFFTGAAVVTFYLIFVLLEIAGFHRRMERAFGPVRAEQIKNVVGSINIAVARYLVVKTGISLLVGLLSALILLAFDLEYAWLWGVLTFLVNYIPYVGSIFAIGLPSLAAFGQFDTLLTPAAIFVLLTIAQQFTGAFLEPRIMGARLGVSPLVIVLSLAFWGYLWGVTGMILSVPLAVSIKITLENIPQTRALGRFVSNI